MIKSDSGWILAPTYDLLNVAILLPEDKEELALTLEGKRKKLTRANFERLGKGLELTDKQIEGVFNRMLKRTPHVTVLIDKSFLSNDMKSAYKSILSTRYRQLTQV